MVVVNEDGTLTVTGDLDLYNSIFGPKNEGEEGDNTFNITKDMQEKCHIVDTYNREHYWYYLDKAELTSQNHIPTSSQYWCVFVYVNIVGTFLSISHWDLASKTSGINTFVRLGNGRAEGANYEPVSFRPAILDLKEFE